MLIGFTCKKKASLKPCARTKLVLLHIVCIFYKFIRFGKIEVSFYQIYFDKVSCQNLLYNFKKKNVLYI